ncbi:MAG TPA: type II toxin-antitoxin system HicA family toxin [Acidobacteriaceae bacterium]|jgi:predicted RNA binding protein YcfA (HicA-like mRNA interferase family)|nr:type II toxin-antitoxin system HicA family toxin [Acidobacteriaceae bacterium]
MSKWPATRASRVYRALLRIGWFVVREKSGSHVQLRHPKYAEGYTWAFHDSVEIGPVMLAHIAKKTGLKPEDL